MPPKILDCAIAPPLGFDEAEDDDSLEDEFDPVELDDDEDDDDDETVPPLVTDDDATAAVPNKSLLLGFGWFGGITFPK